MRKLGLDESHVEVLHFWVDRLEREYRDIIVEVNTIVSLQMLNIVFIFDIL
jgi:hypothetical protein